MLHKKYCIILFVLIIGVFLTACQKDSPDTKEKSEPKTEEHRENTPERNDKVVTINGQAFTYEDLLFYQLMSKVDIELKRQIDEETLKGEALQEKITYWEEQIEYQNNYNVGLYKIIEIHSMSLLAQEKELSTQPEEVKEAVKSFTEKANQNKSAQKLIQDFGKETYQGKVEAYFTEKLLSDQIYNILKEDVKKDKPDATEQEIAFEANKKYDELYQSQVSSLDLEIEKEF